MRIAAIVRHVRPCSPIIGMASIPDAAGGNLKPPDEENWEWTLPTGYVDFPVIYFCSEISQM